MRAHGVGSIDELRRRSVEDMEWFWDAVVKDMGIEFTTPYERVLDSSGGIAWSKWFVGGRVTSRTTASIAMPRRTAPTGSR